MQREYKHWDAELTLSLLSGEVDTLCTLIEMVFEQAPGMLEPLEAPVVSPTLLLTAAHAVKNVCGVFNATKMVEIAGRIQCDLQSGRESPEADRQLLAEQLHMIVRELAQFHYDVKGSPERPHNLDGPAMSATLLPSHLLHPHAR